MYLVHGTVLFAMLNLLYWRVSGLLFGLIYVILTIAISHLFCISVEEPSLRFGKTISEILRRQGV
jgi:peptidoglycan/LPS O-acetylase OafA/YrhL